MSFLHLQRPVVSLSRLLCRCDAPLRRLSSVRLTPHSRSLHYTASAAKGLYADFTVDDGQHEQMLAYLDAVLEFNKHTNLTAVRDRDEAVEKHIRDSLALLPALDAHAQMACGDGHLTLIDVGSGAGFPGMILAIARPLWQVALLDSLRKRCDFVRAAAARLGVGNVAVLWGRAEALGQDPGHRERYDVATARAVAEMRVLAEISLPFVRVGGLLVAAKGPAPHAEVEAAQGALQVLGGRLLGIQPVHGGQRTAVLVRKRAQTPQQYPRREGKPSKRPL